MCPPADIVIEQAVSTSELPYRGRKRFVDAVLLDFGF